MTYKSDLMKKLFLITIAAFSSLSIFAQTETDATEEIKTGGFKPELLFTGGSLNIGYFNGVTSLGATPQLGYSLAKWMDAGIIFGYTYTSQHDDLGTSYRQTIIGPGAFVKLFPIDFLFASVQYEHNFLRQKIIYPGGTEIYKTDVNSLLLGIGYTNGREGRNSPYYYFSVSADVINDPSSPYRDRYNEIYPVVNAGFNIPLFQGSRRR